MATLAQTRILYNRESRDYDLFVSVDGDAEQYIGSATNHSEGQSRIDNYVFNYYVDNHTPEAAVQVLSRPAEVVELLHSADPTPAPDPNDAPIPGGPGEAPGNPSDGEARPYDAFTLMFQAQKLCVRITDVIQSASGEQLRNLLRIHDRAQRRWQRRYQVCRSALPAASPAAAIEARTPDSSDGLGTPTGGREDAAPRLASSSSGFFLACAICGGPHVPTRCPQVALVKYGMGIWEAYLDDRRAFLKLVQWATAARLKLMGDAVAYYLSTRWGHDITGRQVLIAWMQNTASA